jgi:hypothetical protein
MYGHDSAWPSILPVRGRYVSSIYFLVVKQKTGRPVAARPHFSSAAAIIAVDYFRV